MVYLVYKTYSRNMKLSQKIRLSKHILRLLKVNEITYPVGRTSKGNFGICFNANNDDFDIMLDSIPLSTKNSLEDENSIELKKMVTKYLFENEDIIQWPSTRPVVSNDPNEFLKVTPIPESTLSKKKVGRPSKHGNKTNEKS